MEFCSDSGNDFKIIFISEIKIFGWSFFDDLRCDFFFCIGGIRLF